METAAKNGDFAAVSSENAAFLKQCHILVMEIDALMNQSKDSGIIKPVAERIEYSRLAALYNAATEFNVLQMEMLLDGMEIFDYTDHEDAQLLVWLREQVENLEYEEIVKKLEVFHADPE